MIEQHMNDDIKDKLNDLNSVINEIEKTSIKDIKKDAGNFFSYGKVSQTAYLNWRFDSWNSRAEQMNNMSEGYFSTASENLKRILVDNYDKKADLWIFPVLFNTMHGIELSLKNTLLQLDLIKNIQENGSSNDVKMVTDTHDIQKLCNRVLQKLNHKDFNKLWSEKFIKRFKNDMNFVLEFINYIYAETRDMTFVRYPFTNKEENQFYSNRNDNITINLLKYFIWFHKVWSISEDVFYKLDEDVSDLISLE